MKKTKLFFMMILLSIMSISLCGCGCATRSFMLSIISEVEPIPQAEWPTIGSFYKIYAYEGQGTTYSCFWDEWSGVVIYDNTLDQEEQQYIDLYKNSWGWRQTTSGLADKYPNNSIAFEKTDGTLVLEILYGEGSISLMLFDFTLYS